MSVPSFHDLCVKAKLPHADHKACNTFAIESGSAFSISWYTPSGPGAVPAGRCAIVLIRFSGKSWLVWKSLQFANVASSSFVTICMVKVHGSKEVPAVAHI